MDKKYKRAKYTKESLAEAAAKATSIAGVIRLLDLHYSSGRFATVKKKLGEFNINTDHFLGRAANCGNNHKGGKKRPWNEILVLRSKTQGREKAVNLRRALIEMGREYCCAVCNKPPLWNGAELRLRVDHISGAWWDCRPSNVRFLCPDCHSQTPNWGYDNGFTDVTHNRRYAAFWRKQKRVSQKTSSRKKINRVKRGASSATRMCITCGKNTVSKKIHSCKSCALKKREKIKWPDHQTLISKVESSSLTKVAKELDVSISAVRKRIKKTDPLWKSNYKPVPPKRIKSQECGQVS